MIRQFITRVIIALLILSANISTVTRGSAGQRVVTAAQINGTWREVSSKPAGVTTEFWIWALGKQKLKVEFYANNAAKRFSNTAIDTASIEGTTATFQPADNQTDDKNPCVMTLSFAGDKLIVAEKGACGWGAGIGAAGTYKRISSSKPKFDER